MLPQHASEVYFVVSGIPVKIKVWSEPLKLDSLG